MVQPKIDLYIPPQAAGSTPNLAWRAQTAPQDADIIILHQDYRGDLMALSPGSRVLLDIIAHGHLTADLVDRGMRPVLHIGEPPADFDKRFSAIDQPGAEIIMTGAANYGFQHAQVHRIETFFGELRQLYSHLPDLLRPADDQPKPYCFDALLGTPSRLPRSWIRNHLEQQHPGRNIVRTYPPDARQTFRHVMTDHYIWPEGVDFSHQLDQPFFAAAMVSYHGFPAMVCLILPWNVYEQTAYSIVAETHVANAWNFYTEKTGKPMLARRLFVAFCGQYHLRNLRALGFRTFDGIIDESYDLEPDPQRRWQMAMRQVDWLCSQPQQPVLAAVRPIVDHNFHLLTTTDWNQQINDLIIDAVLGKI